MSLQIEAVYENGVLRPLGTLALTEHQHVMATISEARAKKESPNLDEAYTEGLRKQLATSEPAFGLIEVRRRLSKIPGS